VAAGTGNLSVVKLLMRAGALQTKDIAGKVTFLIYCQILLKAVFLELKYDEQKYVDIRVLD
jgi:hypothetical protein